MSALSQTKKPTMLDAFIPVITLIVLLTMGVSYFGDNSSYGPNQIALLIAMGVAIVIGIKNGHKWHDLEKAITHGISLSLGAVLILFAVGSLIGTWLLSGTVPTMIYYGLMILDPAWFYAAACVMCAVVSMSIGSSWTTAATIGVALIGIAQGLGLSPAITAGAVISGAYFGDKISPLSETTNLAPAIAGSELFAHIRYMFWTTMPSIATALILFLFLGFTETSVSDVQAIDLLSKQLSEQFNLSLFNLVPLFVLLVLAIKKVPAFPAVAIGALTGGLWAIVFQQELIIRLGSGESDALTANIIVVWTAFFDGVSIKTGNSGLDDLLSGGGMSSMLNTVWLIMCALSFGAVLEHLGMLKKFVDAILASAKTTGSLIASTVATCIGTNLLTADQYIAIVMPGRMYKEEYQRRGLDPLVLSRTLEDAGTITSPLIPWNTCAVYMSGVLLVNPLDYMFYCFFNWINPILAVIYGFIGFNIKKLTKVTTDKATA
ncbi:Na+/H+ antiporter NhaC [Colwellia psychrerythraea]|uniref:Na+/H+ antiporter NhaC n=1 Tax=Colwellia psychrerythraea TaxID=28229 RepID=A0A099KQQ2_COLPS|nr:Na+/H+ antiporter NhaC [Colwellia psychrerythraea]KGJ92841.1 Na+/H+ antiporter NhaC [Colwellia psychrerythraea]